MVDRKRNALGREGWCRSSCPHFLLLFSLALQNVGGDERPLLAGHHARLPQEKARDPGSSLQEWRSGVCGVLGGSVLVRVLRGGGSRFSDDVRGREARALAAASVPDLGGGRSFRPDAVRQKQLGKGGAEEDEEVCVGAVEGLERLRSPRWSGGSAGLLARSVRITGGARNPAVKGCAVELEGTPPPSSSVQWGAQADARREEGSRDRPGVQRGFEGGVGRLRGGGDSETCYDEVLSPPKVNCFAWRIGTRGLRIPGTPGTNLIWTSIPLLPKVNRGSTFGLRSPTFDFCFGEQRSSRAKYSGSMKSTTHLDDISHCKTASGANW